MAKLKTNKTVSTSQSGPVKPPKKGVLGLVIDAVKNPNKYYKEDNFEKYISQNKTTKNFTVSNADTYKNRAKRYNDSLTLYNKGEIDRAKKKKDVINAVNNHNKNKSFYEPKVEYAGEESLGSKVRQRVRHTKTAQAHSKLWFNSMRALRKGEGKYVETESQVYPKPEYRPVYSPKKATVRKSSSATSVKKTSIPKVTNKPNVKTEVKPSTAKSVAKPVIKDTVVTKPVVKPTITSAPKPAVSNKPSQKIPTIRSSNNYGDTGMVNRGSYKEVKTKMAPKKGPSQFKTVKKNYK
jgi:hypothetical protein